MCPAVNTVDLSALDALEQINTRLAERNITLHLSEVKGPVMDALKRSEFLTSLTGRIFLSQFAADNQLSAAPGEPLQVALVLLGFKQSSKPSFYGCFRGHAETLLPVPFGAKTNLDQITALEVLKQKSRQRCTTCRRGFSRAPAAQTSIPPCSPHQWPIRVCWLRQIP